MNVYLEIFGYIGTALVIISMMMTSVIKLRIFNMCGALISLIYAVCVNTWPVAVLNACLLCINLVQTARYLKGRGSVAPTCVLADALTANHLLGIWKADVEKCHPDYGFPEISQGEVHILYVGAEAIGFFAVGAKEGEGTNLLYLTPVYRTEATKARVLAVLPK